MSEDSLAVKREADDCCETYCFACECDAAKLHGFSYMRYRLYNFDSCLCNILDYLYENTDHDWSLKQILDFEQECFINVIDVADEAFAAMIKMKFDYNLLDGGKVAK